MKALVGAFNEENAVVGAFPEYCETSRRFVVRNVPAVEVPQLELLALPAQEHRVGLGLGARQLAAARHADLGQQHRHPRPGHWNLLTAHLLYLLLQQSLDRALALGHARVLLVADDEDGRRVAEDVPVGEEEVEILRHVPHLPIRGEDVVT